MSEIENGNAARRRYRRRGIYTDPTTAKKIFLNDLSHRLIPSLSFYLFSIIAGICCGIMFLLEMKPLAVLCIALIPFFGPFFGQILGCLAGSFNFLGKSFIKCILAEALFFLSSFGISSLTHFHPVKTADLIQLFAKINPGLMAVTAICSFLTIFLLVVDQQLPQALSCGTMAEILLPLGAAGFCIGTGKNIAAEYCFWNFLVYSLIAFGAGLLGFFVTRNFSSQIWGFIFTILAIGITVIYLLNHFGFINPDLQTRFRPEKNHLLNALSLITYTPTNTVTPTITPSMTSTLTPSLTPTSTFTATSTSTSTPTNTPVPPTSTMTLTSTSTQTKTPAPSQTATRTLPATKTSFPTNTPAPTVVYGIVSVQGDSGLLIRLDPGFGANIIRSMNNGATLELTNETKKINEILWQQVKLNDGTLGWVAATLIRTATPSSIK